MFPVYPIFPRFAPGLSSSGPGVLIPNTPLGNSRLALLEVTPRVVSNNNPCWTNLSAKGCTGFGIPLGLNAPSKFLVKNSATGVGTPSYFSFSPGPQAISAGVDAIFSTGFPGIVSLALPSNVLTSFDVPLFSPASC